MQVIVEGNGFRWAQTVRTDARGHSQQCVDVDGLLRTHGRTVRLVPERDDSVAAMEIGEAIRRKFPAPPPGHGPRAWGWIKRLFTRR